MVDFKHPIYGNNGLREMTPEEVARYASENEKAEREYWSISYAEAVSREIHKRYSPDDEIALARQKDRKPDEWATYDAYCEECKVYVKEQQAKYGGDLSVQN